MQCSQFMNKLLITSWDLRLPRVIQKGGSLLLLLNRFSHVRLCATPQTAAHPALPSRQEHWSGLPFLSPMHERESEVSQSCPTLRNPMDCSLPGSSSTVFSRQQYWNGVPLPSPELGSGSAQPARSLPARPRANPLTELEVGRSLASAALSAGATPRTRQAAAGL